MAVWVVVEESRHLLRADAVVSIAAVLKDGDATRWARTHPSKRISGSDLAQIVVATTSGDRGSVLTCPGRNAAEAHSPNWFRSWRASQDRTKVS